MVYGWMALIFIIYMILYFIIVTRFSYKNSFHEKTSKNCYKYELNLKWFFAKRNYFFLEVETNSKNTFKIFTVK